MDGPAAIPPSSTRVVLNSYSRLWEFPRKLAEMLGLAKPQLSQNWLTKEDLKNLLYLAGFETIRGVLGNHLAFANPGAGHLL